MKKLMSSLIPLTFGLAIISCAQIDDLLNGEQYEDSVQQSVTSEVENESESVASTLSAYQEGQLEPGELVITYSDLHAFHGGFELIIDGLGNVQQQAIREEVQEPKNLSPEEVKEIVSLLIELEAWKQIVPEREPLPDESRAILWIEAGGSSSQIWEWYNDMVGNDRLIRIRERMKELAWK
jgi:hypothetical protein